MENITWSLSKVETLLACPFKYSKVYIDKTKETSTALTLGGDIHEVVANSLEVEDSNVDSIIDRMRESYIDTDLELLAMAPHVASFVKTWYAFADPLDMDTVIEKQYALNRQLEQVDFNSPEAYIRGVFDIYGYDYNNEQLVIIDHKSNAKLGGPAYVKKHHQLLLYAFMLIKILKIQPKSIKVGIHFIRFGKIVYADHTPKEVQEFSDRFLHLLMILDERTTLSYETSNWEKQGGWQCSWCSFKAECKGTL